MSKIVFFRIAFQIRQKWLAAIFLAAVFRFLTLADSVSADETIGFNPEIRSILTKNCLACHGRDESARKADLRLDRRDAAISSNAIVPGKPTESELIQRIESDDPESVMPPPDSGHQLSMSEIETLRSWIQQGATYQQHWAFTPPTKAPFPKTKLADWAIAPLDHFVLGKLESQGLKPSPTADRAEWLRRVSLDLAGLPPTIEQADRFLADESDQAFEKVVDRLLNSESFGEHWARMWLDLARYADTKGYEKDRHRDIWRYRDWVIAALNRDTPYDQFTIEQLAGDLLPEPTTDQLLATAFHRNTMENDEGGTDDEEFRVAAVKDRVDTTIQVWMGLTMGCAKCHSHKYDPISQQDYYAFYAFFNQTEDADREPPVIPTPTATQREQVQSFEAELSQLDQQLNNETSEFVEAWKIWQAQFDDQPIWKPLRLSSLESNAKIKLDQEADGTLDVDGELPEKDTWKLVVDLTAGQTITAIRFDTFPKQAGGKWSDKNVAMRELTVESLEPGKEPRQLKLTQPRADFSQRGWEVARAIDGKSDAGWAFSPQASQPHAAVFDLSEPLTAGTEQQLRFTIDQEYGQGLTFDRFRISASSHPVEWLTADLDPDSKLKTTFQRQIYPETKTLIGRIDNLRNSLNKVKREIPKTPIMRELSEAKQRVTRTHVRGNFLDPGDEVSPALLPEFGDLPDEQVVNRLGVARWLMHPSNPLTSRVMVNRIWARLFGIGLVETEEDFGMQGLPPSHPQLLDWLAVEFREEGWSIKQLIREIVLSQTYRQTSAATDQQVANDPRNRLLGRGPRFRLTAEIIRDQALAAAGLLTQKIGGPSVMPPQPGGVWKTTYSGEDWKNSEGPNRYRRGLYTYLKRTSPYPAMITFDAGSGEVCQIRRVRTNTPLQALVTLNDTVFVESAGALAQQMEQAGDSINAKISHGFRRVLTRQPNPIELKRLVTFYQDVGHEIEDGEALLKAAGLKTGDPKLIAVANVLLNLDETLMKP